MVKKEINKNNIQDNSEKKALFSVVLTEDEKKNLRKIASLLTIKEEETVSMGEVIKRGILRIGEEV